MTGSQRARWAGSGAATGAVAFVVLGVLVATGATHDLDVAARDLFRPSREWTPAQGRADLLVEGLQPAMVAAVLVLVGLCTSLRRRSWVPLAQAAAIGFVGGLAALIAKFAVGRPDPSNEMSAFAGSFPSGHVVSVLVCLGGAVLVLSARSRWWHWALVLATAAGMGYGMLIQSAHWFTDVTGGALLGVTVLAAATVVVRRGVGPRTSSSMDVDAGPGHPTSPDGGFCSIDATRLRSCTHAENMTDSRTFRIAIVHSYYSSRQSSGENHVVDQQVDVLRRAGHTVALVSRRTDDHERRWAFSLRAAATVATGIGPDPVAQLDGFRPDVVLVNNLFPNYGRTWVRRWSGPIVAVMHNYRPLCPVGTFYRQGEVCTDCLDRRTAWPSMQHGCYRGTRVATAPLAVGTRFGRDPLLDRADRVIVLNARMRDLYERGGVSAARLRQVPNFLSRPLPAGPGGDTWLYVGRLTEEKGILPLVREWPRDARLDVVGAGPLADAVAEVAPDSVKLLGEQSATRVSELMRSSRGLVFPSRWFEGFPMVYLEALAAGTPVIAWEPSVVADMVRDEQTGLVADNLASTLGEATRTFPAMRQQCRSVFEARYTRDSWVTSMEDLFHEVAGSTAR